MSNPVNDFMNLNKALNAIKCSKPDTAFHFIKLVCSDEDIKEYQKLFDHKKYNVISLMLEDSISACETMIY